MGLTPSSPAVVALHFNILDWFGVGRVNFKGQESSFYTEDPLGPSSALRPLDHADTCHTSARNLPGDPYPGGAEQSCSQTSSELPFSAFICWFFCSFAAAPLTDPPGHENTILFPTIPGGVSKEHPPVQPPQQQLSTGTSCLWDPGDRRR